MHRSQQDRGQKGTRKRLLVAACASVMLALAPAHVAVAAQDATLSMDMVYEATGEIEYVDGVEMALYKVADLDEAINHYTLLERYASLGVDFDAGLTASQMQEAAKQAAQIAEQGDEPAATAVSGANGRASFGTLEYGVYVVVQTGATGTAEEYEDNEPFLVSVPQVTEEGIAFDVVCEPKLTPEKHYIPYEPPIEPPKHEGEVPKPKTPTPTPTKLVQTSDLMSPEAVVGCVAGGAVLVAVGMTMRKRTKVSK